MREGAASISFRATSPRLDWITPSFSGDRLFLKLPGALQEAPLPLCLFFRSRRGVYKLSICWAAILRAFNASFGLRRFIGCDPERPNSTSRRIVSDHGAVSFRAAHFRLLQLVRLVGEWQRLGLRPVAGRPRFFDMTFLDFAII
jgi:hypothetical protein